MVKRTASPVVPLTTWAPDLDPKTKGILIECQDLIPTHRGFCGAPSQVAVVGLAAIPGGTTANGAALVTKLDGSTRMLVGTSTTLQEAAGSSWTDVSRVGAYTVSPDVRWKFAQFGNTTLAVNGADVIQASSSGAFSDVTGSPKAAVLECAAGFVMVAATNEVTYGDSPDRWWCSGLFNHTQWTPSVATQCATGRLVDTPGPIVALKKLGNDLVAYKETSMYLGRYVGAPEVWRWQLISDSVGALCQGAIVNVGPAHIFIGRDDIWYFDGTRPVSLNSPVRYWFFDSNNSRDDKRNRMMSYFDRFTDRVWFFFMIPGGSGNFNAMVYHVKRNAWGRVTNSLENGGAVAAVLDYVTTATTFDDVGVSYSPSSTYNNFGNGISYNSSTWFSNRQIPAVVQAGLLKTLTGPLSHPALAQVFEQGADDRMFLGRRCRPNWIKAPTAVNVWVMYKMNDGDVFNQAPGAGTMVDGKLDFLVRARWLSPQIYVTAGDFELAGIQLDMDPMGMR